MHFRACAGTLNVTQGQTRVVAVAMVAAAAVVEGVEVQVQEGVPVVEIMMIMITTMEDPHQEVPAAAAVEGEDADGALQLQHREAVDEVLLGPPHRHLPTTLMVCKFTL